jgi:hypothetical protein
VAPSPTGDADGTGAPDEAGAVAMVMTGLPAAGRRR